MRSDKDQKLIEQAKATSCYQYDKIMDLIEQADSDDTRFVLDRIAAHKYHEEEAKAGMI